MTEPIRVFLVDDQEMVRAGFRMLVDSQADLEVVGEAGDGVEAVQQLAVTRRRRRADGRPDAAAGRRRGHPAARPAAATRPAVIVLTTFDLDEYAFAAIKAGAAAFLLKDAAPPELLDAIRAVHAGDAVVAPSTTRRLLEHFAQALPDPQRRRPPTRAWPASPIVSARCSAWSAGAGPTTRSPPTSWSPRPRSRPTSAGCWPRPGSRDRVQLVVLAYETGVVGSSGRVRPRSYAGRPAQPGGVRPSRPGA